ncbi:HAD family hydrolase [Sphingomonas sp. H39-1-10]|uniref:HAD family hydrolase n=1 Tax=Sphingomonas pollutisoli TaxID=3030829 RepID=UPI0023B9CD4F|nr:HAD family hydrolase [Sphingomonas pollutisoli]MDF0489036.1 HAD family hydrolase [Sphingomonas pollutisoli]
MTIDLICLDADDTLWHNMRHFNGAEAAFAAILAPFVEAGVACERLHAVEAVNLAQYGYGAKSFTLSMIETAVDLLGDAAAGRAVADILAVGRDLLAHPVELLPGTAETLTALADRGRLVLVTKGDLLHQETKIAASGVGELFSAIEIVSDKSVATFERLFDRFGVAPECAVMAGDSMRSDVLPALGAGAWAAYIPQPDAWQHEAGDTPEQHPRFRRLAALTELPGWIDEIK